MDRVFQVLAVVLAGVAACFLWKGNGDGGFVAAVVGAVAFFLSIRVQVKRRNEAREAERVAADKAAPQTAEPDEPDAVVPADNEQLTTNKF